MMSYKSSQIAASARFSDGDSSGGALSRNCRALAQIAHKRSIVGGVLDEREQRKGPTSPGNAGPYGGA
jgi:hypothetical protein